MEANSMPPGYRSFSDSDHDCMHHRMVAEKPHVGAAECSAAGGMGDIFLAPYGVGRRPRSFRRASHHQDRLSEPTSAGGGRPGHFSDHFGVVVGAWLDRGARFFDVWRILCVCDLSGRHRSLLGTFARVGIFKPDRGSPAAGSHFPRWGRMLQA